MANFGDGNRKSKSALRGSISTVDLLELTSTDLLLIILKIMYFLYKTRCLNVEVNCTEHSLSVRVPGLKLEFVSYIAFYCNIRAYGQAYYPNDCIYNCKIIIGLVHNFSSQFRRRGTLESNPSLITLYLMFEVS